MGVKEETSLLTRYCFSLISLGTYALRLCLVCAVDVRVRPRSSVGILEGALDLTADLCKVLFLQSSYGDLQTATGDEQTDSSHTQWKCPFRGLGLPKGRQIVRRGQARTTVVPLVV